jgi:uncharacterized protein YjbI with pentapeptide repeats
MAFLNPLKNKITAWGRTHKRSLVVIGVIAAISTPLLIFSPGGWGIWKEESVVTRTIEKDKQGNEIKTIETTKLDSGKTLWDWLSLLGVPLTLAILGYWLQQKQQKRTEGLAKEQRDRDLAIAKQQRERDEEIAKQQRELAANEAKEEVLQVYFDRLSTLLVDKNLRAIAAKVNAENPEASQAKPEEQELLASAMDVIRARTLSILRRFEKDAERKTSVIGFLIEADIVNKLKLDLSGADLSNADIRIINISSIVSLSKANLSKANLSEAFLGNAYFEHTDLSDANLSSANLSGSILIRAILRKANLSKANLLLAYLRSADLGGADLRSADLRGADLSGANLIGADLSSADLSNANLNGVNLSGFFCRDDGCRSANLKNIKWNSETKWPDKEAFANARNIPEELRKQLDLPEQNL